MKPGEQISLLVTAGDGPAECNQAVAHIIKRMKEEAVQYDVDLSVHLTAGRHGPKSAVVIAYGIGRHTFAKSWCGTIQWRMQSQVRRHHKRNNWFVGVFLTDQTKSHIAAIQKTDVAFSTLRAGGPGGQHQNTTDSAVRATHGPSGLTVVVRQARSQHRNKELALERLQELADAEAANEHANQKVVHNQLHSKLERGNPVRRFWGSTFAEEKT